MRLILRLLVFAMAMFHPTFAFDAPVVGNFNQPLDRNFSLGNQGLPVLEGEYHRMAAGSAPRSYILPRPCLSEVDLSRVCGEGFRWGVGDTIRHRVVTAVPVLGYETRSGSGQDHEFGFGILASGTAGPLSFFLDARMFTELQEKGAGVSPDREPVDWQDEEASGSFAYASFSRYRSNLSYDWSWGRLTVARDAAHWGPGLLNNLVFHQDAVPFDQVTFTTHLGPINVQSLYGRLIVEEDHVFDRTPRDRSVYAHRYEWNVMENLLLGVSEQLISYDHEEPFAAVPLVPLFIFKGQGYERLNNGNIAGDVSWRWPGRGTIYTEFLIDDIQAPTALFNDEWGNKWAWMAGAHGIGRAFGKDLGVIAEYARIEPWVYTHYESATAQSANAGYPLGNQLGPNSQSANLKAYLRNGETWLLSARLDLVWKGTDPGSGLADEIEDRSRGKEFIRGIGRPKVRFLPEGRMRWGPALLKSEAGFGDGGFSWKAGLQVQG